VAAHVRLTLLDAIFEKVMNGSWRLITAGRRYLPPASADDPVAHELRTLAERDRAAGRTPADWSSEERERWRGHYRALMTFYDPVRWPERLLAPPAWRDEAVLIAMATLIAALGERMPDTLWFARALLPVWHVMDAFDERARRRSAARLGLTAETMPRNGAISGALFHMAATLGPWTWRKLRRKPVPASPPWATYLAARTIYAINERRSWRRAVR
jgi:hypothetical protein